MTESIHTALSHPIFLDAVGIALMGAVVFCAVMAMLDRRW